ncbi:DEKNAAC103838 [Brettanomyces naardenensis]|uniref:DEKNAAC103838 n=1 Tax=Brettanomyces naardenensis TaxID=13370 RepID=A0A448YPE8_BRENA|nr:DEKNAAC103838 [Brettanomyces naardenensis]
MLSRILRSGATRRPLTRIPQIRLQSGLPGGFPARGSSATEYANYYRKKARSERAGSYIRKGVLGIITLSMIMIIWQPWNQYSKEVSFRLRKGLWAEEGKKRDYLKALDYYQQAIDQCNEEEMDQLDPRYSGIVLKLAEMYEKLGMVDRQREVYERLSDYLFGKLLADDVKEEWKDILIDRDLVISTRLLVLADKGRVREASERLLQRMEYCEERMKEKWPFLVNVGSRVSSGSDVQSSQASNSSGAPPFLNILDVLDMDGAYWSISAYRNRQEFVDKYCAGDAKKFLNQWATPAWPYFSENLIRARDLYAMMDMAVRSPDFSIELLKSNILWMELSGFHPIYMGTAVMNLASAYYLKSERHQLHISDLERIMKEEKDEDESLKLEMILANEVREQAQAIDSSKKIYEKLIEKLGGVESARKLIDNQQLQACLSMALYSLGVIEMHGGDYTESERYFAEAKEIAAENGMSQIVERIDGESEALMELPTKV